jgi:hypothetical protein
MNIIDTILLMIIVSVVVSSAVAFFVEVLIAIFEDFPRAE